jgi:hypothetical protein
MPSSSAVAEAFPQQLRPFDLPKMSYSSPNPITLLRQLQLPRQAMQAMLHPAPGLSSSGSEKALLLSRGLSVAELDIHIDKTLLNSPSLMAITFCGLRSR